MKKPFINPLVTGGCGFLGSSLVRILSPISETVTVIDNLSTGLQSNINHLTDKNLRFIQDDIRNDSILRNLIRESDIIFHLACLGVRHSLHSPIENNDVNSTATLQMLKIAKEENIKRFIHVSSSEVYGTGTFIPIDENTPTFPHTVYGSSKLAGECHARAFYKSYSFPSVILRPFNVYGPRCHHEGDSGEVIPKFLLRVLAGKPMLIFGSGNQTRDFTFVDDTARAIKNAALSSEVIGHTINIGSGKEISINNLTKVIGFITNSTNPLVEHIDPRPGDVERLYSNSKLAEKLLNFKPKVDLISGLQELLTWYQEQEICPSELLTDDVDINWEKTL